MNNQQQQITDIKSNQTINQKMNDFITFVDGIVRDDEVYDEDENENEDDYSDTEDEDSDSDEEERFFARRHKFCKLSPVLCEIYNEKIHGPPKDAGLNSQYLVIREYKSWCDVTLTRMHDTASVFNSNYKKDVKRIAPHSDIRNYAKIVTKKNYVRPEIAMCLTLPTGESVCVLKTFWLRIVQRTWKRIYKLRMELIKKRKNPAALMKRGLGGGDWNKQMPGVRGMLSTF